MLYYAHLMWSSLTVGVVTSVLIVREIGWDGLFGVVVVLIVCPIQSWTGTMTAKFRKKSAEYGDRRVKLMSEILAGIETIKVQVWEKPFKIIASKLRTSELKWIARASYVRALYMTFSIFTTRMALFITLFVYIVSGNRLSADKVFVISSLYSIMSNTLAGAFIRGVAELSELKVSIQRIQVFLNMKEKSDEARTGKIEIEENENLIKSDEIATELKGNLIKGRISVKNASASWVEGGDVTLNKINLRVEPGSLVAVIGAVGSGKSSLIQALLGELPWGGGGGGVEARGVSYSSQEPWVFSGSVRENVVFGRPFERRRYNQVLKACCLLPDLKRMRNGDATLVGERGGALSGGQKARLTLARAAYAQHVDAYLLDEPLAALDVNVAKHVFDECVDGLLRGTTRVLVTNQLHLLRNADLIVVMNRAKIVAQGSFVDVANNESMNELIKEIIVQPILKEGARDNDGETDHQSYKDKCQPQNLNENQRRVRLPLSQYLLYWTKSGSFTCLFLLIFLFFLTQTIVSVSDFWVTVCIGKDNNASNFINNFLASDSVFNCLNVYLALMTLLFTLALARSILYFRILKNSSINIHKSMLSSVLSAEYEFFIKTPSGTILNRFSSDLLSVDVTLPRIMLDTIQYFTLISGSLIIIFVISPVFLVPVGAFLFAILKAKEYYLETSRVLKRVDATSRSPIFTRLSETFEGITLIRAFVREEILKQEMSELLDVNYSSSLLLFGTSTAFGFFLDVICVACVALLIIYFVNYSTTYTSENVGLALTQAISITGLLQWCVRQSAETENLMTNFERVMEYSNLKKENETVPELSVPKGWPNYGQIKFDNVSVNASGKVSILQNINIRIQSGEKIGVVGRTGAGKSSLIKALFRLIAFEGEITIDGVNISKVHTHNLRRNISMISQNPTVFAGSIRRNLDPSYFYSDKKLYGVLRDVGLSSLIYGPDEIGKDVDLNLSVGQKQLLCLARAILRTNRILILDEATANIDFITDSHIKKLLDEKFPNCTVLTIAHKPRNVHECDRVILLESGRIVK
ncbi:probable multidrug resistance-associated protein lethal(2)03659 isoform X2 [Neocloeon triangulifer]|nr:probable multidrug resistance-associated protein lethal(2)03659 isoform X2 [Neocloeon triangulifer]